MPKLLFISGDEDLDPRPDPDWELDRVDDLDGARESLAAHEWSVVVVDLRTGVFELELLQNEPQRVPAVAIVPASSPHLTLAAKEANIACVDAAWIDGHDCPVLRTCIRQIVGAARQASELQSFKERKQQLLHAEKFAAVGLLAAEIAHEINNPATFVITNLTVMIDYVRTIGRFHAALRERLRQEGSIDAESFVELESEHEIAFLDEDLDALLERSLAGLNRIHHIVQDLRYFSRDRQTESGWVDVEGLVRASVSLVRHEARFRTEIAVDLGDLPPVKSDANRLSQVILNVMVNAVQAIPPGRPARHLVEVTGQVRDGVLQIRVADTGPGIEPELLDRIFDPFFTTKEPGVGTGLGLSIASEIMGSLGGRLTAESKVGEGATFTIHVPLRGKRSDEEE